MQGLWVVGVLFGLAFLMVVGLHSVLRELFMRGPYPSYSQTDGDDADEAVSEREDSSLAPSMGLRGEIDDRDNGGIDVQARRV